MTGRKRLFDIIFALVLAALLWPVFVVVALLILTRDGAPIFYASERMKTADTGFQLIKFRTMTVAQNDGGVSGGDKTGRVTKTGRFLRKTRMDELPQLWNILRGDMSFVGPRPPLRIYVERFPDLYANVLHNRPGVTGLASLYFHAHEESLLSKCVSAEQTDHVYARRCVPRKARLDMIYQTHQSVCFDMKILVLTCASVLRRR